MGIGSLLYHPHHDAFMRLLFVLTLIVLFGSSAWASTLTYVGPSSYSTIPCTDFKFGCPSLTKYATFTLTYTPSQTIAPNGKIRLGIGFVEGSKFMTDVFEHWAVAQTTNPTQINYATISSPVPVTKSIIAGDVAFLQLTFPSGLAAGVPITITYGDTSGGSKGHRIPAFESLADVFVLEDFSNTGTFGMMDGSFPQLWVTGHQTDRVVVLVQSTPSVNVDTSFLVKAMTGVDSYQTNSYINGIFTGTVSFTSSDPLAQLPAPYTFTADDKGTHSFRMRFKTPGYQTVTATVTTPVITGVSNIADVRAKPAYKAVSTMGGEKQLGPLNVYWGSIHNHTAAGGHATQTTPFVYEYARNRSFLNFVAVSEHCGKTDFDFDHLTNLADSYNVPNRFVTLPAYEWTSPTEGHRHVLFPNSTNAVAFCDAPTSQIAEKEKDSFGVNQFFTDVASAGGLAVLHHPAWTITSAVVWGPVNSAAQRLVEIYSWHGRSEYYNNPQVVHNGFQYGPTSGNFVQDALAAGYRLGITADGDNHFGMPGSNVGKGWTGGYYSRMGITAVLSDSLTRDSVYDALYNRRVYGTTGARILLSFKSQSHYMGEEFSSVAIPQLDIKVAGTAPLDYVKIFRNGKTEVFSWTGNGSDKTTSLVFKDTAAVPGNTYSYYVRVHQTDDHYAWSSPIWITFNAPAGVPTGFADETWSSLHFDSLPTHMRPDAFPFGVTLALVDLLGQWGGVLPTKTIPSTQPNPEAVWESFPNFNGDTVEDNPHHDLSPDQLHDHMEEGIPLGTHTHDDSTHSHVHP